MPYSSPTTTGITSIIRRSGPWQAGQPPRLWCHSGSVRTCSVGGSPRSGSVNSTGGRAPLWAPWNWCPPPPGTLRPETPRSNETLWSGWAMRGPQHRVWYSGDTGYFAELAQIGQRLGPFDVTLIDSGQYDEKWPDTHLSPELAVQANTLVGGKLMVPVHWGRFNLAPHSWTEPIERVRAEAACRGQSYLPLVPGVPTEPSADAVAGQQQWWPQLPWRSAAEAPINPTVNGDPDQRVNIDPCSTGTP
nr:MBL fold metallo-hydrolase [Actinoplanes aureus]